MRYNVGAFTSGGCVRLKAYRTQATVTKTIPTLVGRANVDPPSSSLDGLTLFVLISDSSGYTLTTVTFDSGSTSPSAIVTDINAARRASTA